MRVSHRITPDSRQGLRIRCGKRRGTVIVKERVGPCELLRERERVAGRQIADVLAAHVGVVLPRCVCLPSNSGTARAYFSRSGPSVAMARTAGFRKYWTWLSRRHRAGRPSINTSLRKLILRMAAENPTWGAPRIHGELRMLGIEASERTVSRYLPRQRPAPGALERWIKFLRNHRDAIAAMDFVTVPTATFRILYVWFAIDHARRRVLHFDVTDRPAAAWVVQQLREAFPHDSPVRHLIFDRDAIFSERVVTTANALGLRTTRTALPEPVAERRRRTLDRKRAPGTARSRRRPQRAPTPAIAGGVCRLLPRRPHACCA